MKQIWVTSASTSGSPCCGRGRLCGRQAWRHSCGGRIALPCSCFTDASPKRTSPKSVLLPFGNRASVIRSVTVGLGLCPQAIRSTSCARFWPRRGIPAGEGVGFEIFDRAAISALATFVQRTGNYLRCATGRTCPPRSPRSRAFAPPALVIVMPENRLLFFGTKSEADRVRICRRPAPPACRRIASTRFASLVANSVEGLHADDVALSSTAGETCSPRTPKEEGSTRAPLPAEDEVSEERRGVFLQQSGDDAWHSYWARATPSCVRVSAEIDTGQHYPNAGNSTTRRARCCANGRTSRKTPPASTRKRTGRVQTQDPNCRSKAQIRRPRRLPTATTKRARTASRFTAIRATPTNLIA